MTLHLSFPDHGSATLLCSKGDHAELLADFSPPPGSSLTGWLDGGKHSALMKIRSCRSDTQGGYRLQVRWVNLPRATRWLLESSTEDQAVDSDR